MRIYISGKISGLHLEVAKGYFAQVEIMLRKSGHVPLNPMASSPYHPDKTWNDYMIEDIKLLFASDAIYMLENWQDSKGAKIEHAIAKEIGLKIFYEGTKF